MLVNDGQFVLQTGDTPTSSDAQPQIEIFADRERLPEQSDVAKTSTPNNHGRSKDEAVADQGSKAPPGRKAFHGKTGNAFLQRPAEETGGAYQPDVRLILQDRYL